jgi:hypothetical protein
MTAAAWVPDQRSQCSLVRDDEPIFDSNFKQQMRVRNLAA